MIENIKKLYSQVDYKTGFIEDVADALGKSPNTLRHHWFARSGFWSIPEEHQPKVVEMLQSQIKKQNEIQTVQ